MASVVDLLWLVPAGAVAGLTGAVAMGVPMRRQPEGWTPALVAASVVRRCPSDRVSGRDAQVVHYVAGGLVGVLYALVAAPLASLVAGTPAVGSLPVLAHLAAVAVVVAFVYVFFAHLVLPRAENGVPEGRATAVRGQWLRSSLVFGATLAVVVPVLAAA